MGSDPLPSTVVALPTRLRKAHLRLVTDATGRAERRGAVTPIATGTLVALPILTTPDARPFDLLEAANDSPVLLLFVAGDHASFPGETAATAISLSNRIEAAAARLFIISSREDAVGDTSALLLDRNGGFAYSLGLAEWDYERGCADLARPVCLVLDDVGRVIAADLGGSPDLDQLVGCLPKNSMAHPGGVCRW